MQNYRRENNEQNIIDINNKKNKNKNWRQSQWNMWHVRWRKRKNKAEKINHKKCMVTFVHSEIVSEETFVCYNLIQMHIQ